MIRPLELQTNVDKAVLLQKLFPSEVAPLVKFVASQAMIVLENKENLKNEWSIPLVSAEHWVIFAESAISVIQKYETRFKKQPRFFSSKLFDGLMALFVIDCLVKYAKQEVIDKKFSQAVNLIFEE